LIWVATKCDAKPSFVDNADNVGAVEGMPGEALMKASLGRIDGLHSQRVAQMQ
jgi:hypothetical protein